VRRLLASFRGALRTGTPVRSLARAPDGVRVDGERFDRVVCATHADQALALLAEPSPLERRVLGGIPYLVSRCVLHTDVSFLPRRRAAWASWNYLHARDEIHDRPVCGSYWMNLLQGIDGPVQYVVTLNPAREIPRERILYETTYAHPHYTAASVETHALLPQIQNPGAIVWAGAWTGYGFHEDGLKSALRAVRLLDPSCVPAWAQQDLVGAASAATVAAKAAPTAQTTRIENVFDLVPADPRATYDMHRLLEAVCDPGSVLELKPLFDGSLVTALARIAGQNVGVLASNPKVTAGAMGPGACEKATSFICLCDSFHIPLVFLHDTPGFFVGRRAEEGAMPLKIMNWIEALHHCTVPRISVIVRKSYGMAHCNMSGGNMGNDVLLAWPGADVSFMAPAVAVNVVYGRKLQEMPDPAAARAAFMEEISRANAPWDAAGRGFVDRVIDPRDTRAEIARALARAGPARSRRLLANWPRMA